MKKTMKLGYFFVAAITAIFSACQSDPILEESLFIDEAQVAEIIKDGKLYDLDSLVSTFMTEVGNYHSDTTNYRTAANNEAVNPGIWLFSIDTLPTNGPGIYIRAVPCHHGIRNDWPAGSAYIGRCRFSLGHVPAGSRAADSLQRFRYRSVC